MASQESILQTIQNYIRSLDSKKGKDVGMTPTGAATTPKEGVVPSGGASIPQDTAPKPNYPDAPKRTVAPITGEIPTAGTPASLAASTAAKMLQQQRNLEVMNEDVEQKSWYEQMRDASDIYKADIGLDRDKKRYDYMMERDAAKAALEAEKIAQRGDIAEKNIDASLEGRKYSADRSFEGRKYSADKTAELKREIAPYSNNSLYRTTFNEYIKNRGQFDSKTKMPTDETMRAAHEYAKNVIAGKPATADPTRSIYADIAKDKDARVVKRDEEYNEYAAKVDRVLNNYTDIKKPFGSVLSAKRKGTNEKILAAAIRAEIKAELGENVNHKVLDEVLKRNGL